jgi:hypothetical protein
MVERLLAFQCHLDLFAFVEKPSNSLGFRAILPNAAVVDDSVLPNLRGLRLNREDSVAGVSLNLIATSGSFHDVFISLVSDLLNQSAKAETADLAAAALLERLTKWHMFLRNLPAEGLSPSEQRGLYGELWFLRHEVLARRPALEAVKAWTGPSRAGKDFQFSHGAVEVKTSIADGDPKLEIHGERQLDSTGYSRLALALLSLVQLQSGGETLPQMVAATRALAIDNVFAQQEIEDRLLESGYWDVHEGNYVGVGYLVRGLDLFDVRPGFPRIVGSDLPVGVGGVTYYISVSACSVFKINSADFWVVEDGPE